MADIADLTKRRAESKWLLILIGLLGIVAGIIVLARPAPALTTLALVTGIFLVIDGIFELVETLLAPGDRREGLEVVFAFISVIAGVLLMRHPARGVVLVALLLGFWLIISGMIRFGSARGLLQDGRQTLRAGWIDMLIAVIELIAGIVIVSSPAIGVRTLALVVGISFILRGLALCALGWLLPRFLNELHGRSARRAAAN